jgi:hypothetical protein
MHNTRAYDGRSVNRKRLGKASPENVDTGSPHWRRRAETGESAIVALGHRLLRLIYYVLLRSQPYQDSNAPLTSAMVCWIFGMWQAMHSLPWLPAL